MLGECFTNSEPSIMNSAHEKLSLYKVYTEKNKSMQMKM